jgi:hypothetical protein
VSIIEHYIFFFYSKIKNIVLDNTLLSPQTHAATKNFSRWSTSRLNGSNSNSTSPCSSTRSSFNYRQPYLGWRSQEKLSKPRTPAERLAAGLLAQQQHEPVLSIVINLFFILYNEWTFLF